MVEQGKVTALEYGKATVEIPRKSACDKCGMCLIIPTEQVVRITLDNQVDAKVGDTVELTMGGSYVLIASLITYFVPLVFFALGIILGAVIISELAGIIGGVIFAVIVYVIIALLDKKFKLKRGFAPTITRIICKGDNNE